MKILPIINQSNQQTFMGLLGRKSFESVCNEYNSFTEEIQDYHPFKDELCKKGIHNKEHMTYDLGGESTSYTSYINIKDNLPFTEKEFYEYKALKGKYLSEAGIKVEDGLAQAKLYNYMNSKFKYFYRKVSQALHKGLK